MIKPKSKLHAMILAALFAALIAVGAFIKIPFPVCPFTLQTLFVCLAGIMLPPAVSASSAAVYMALGLVGLPIFAGSQGPAGGIGYVLIPTFGFVLSFIAQGATTSFLIKKTKLTKIWQLFIFAMIGVIVSYIIGCTYFYFIYNFAGKGVETPMSVWAVINVCALVYLPFDAVKAFVASITGKKLCTILNK